MTFQLEMSSCHVIFMRVTKILPCPDFSSRDGGSAILDCFRHEVT